MVPFSGVVLTGGRSRRMGADKAFIAVDGQPMVVRVATALRAAGAAEVLAVGGDRAGLVALGLDGRDDPRQGQGPLGGLLTAFDLAGHDAVVVLATDLAWIDAGTVGCLVAALDGDAVDTAAAHAGRLEPLCAAWSVARCRPALERAYASGERAVHRALAPLRVVEVPVAADVVRNANTPADLGR